MKRRWLKAVGAKVNPNQREHSPRNAERNHHANVEEEVGRLPAVLFEKRECRVVKRVFRRFEENASVADHRRLYAPTRKRNFPNKRSKAELFFRNTQLWSDATENSTSKNNHNA